jgi:outer membrane protein
MKCHPLVRWVLLTWMLAGSVHAQELKIGVVNVDRVLRDASPARAAQVKLEHEFRRRDAELMEMASRLRAASEKFDKESAAMGDGDRVRRQRELVDMEREIQRKRRAYQEDMGQRKNEELSSLLDRVAKAVKQISDQEKYDLIVQEAMYASARVDITDKVIRVLNGGPSK